MNEKLLLLRFFNAKRLTYLAHWARAGEYNNCISAEE